MSGSKISIVLAATALAVSVLFATPLGQAASRFVLPKNSVGAAQLKKDAVGTKKIAKNAVNSAKVKDGSLLATDFKAGQLPAGPKGDPGLRGPKGDTGAAGSPGLSGVQTVEASSNDDSNSAKEVTAFCPAGKQVIGTGATTYGGFGAIAIASVRRNDANSVNVIAFEAVATPATWHVEAQAICAKVS